MPYTSVDKAVSPVHGHPTNKQVDRILRSIVLSSCDDCVLGQRIHDNVDANVWKLQASKHTALPFNCHT